MESVIEPGPDLEVTEADERLEPYADIAAREAGWLNVKFVHERCPIVDVSVPRSPQETAGILDAIDWALDDGRTVYLHCWEGVGRTGNVDTIQHFECKFNGRIRSGLEGGISKSLNIC